MASFKSVNPFNNERIGEYPILKDPEILAILQQSENAFEQWRRTDFGIRGSCMRQLGDLLLLNKEELARLATLEMGKTFPEAIAEIEKCAYCCQYFADHTRLFLQEQEYPSDAVRSVIRYEPLGSILAVMPWNFPFWQVFRFAAPSIMAGNVALLKHAPNVCGVALAIENIFLKAGFPPGVFQTLIIETEKTEMVISHRSVQGITLTGSELAGSQVAALAGRAIKKSVMELGGSDPFIVLEDADFEKAAAAAIRSRMQNAGQSCIAAKRFITVGSSSGPFLELLTEGIRKLRQGDPFAQGIDMGPMARPDLAEKLEEQVRASVAMGAVLVTGGKRSGCNFPPALLKNIQPGMPAAEQEIFGPVACVMHAGTEKEAIEIANRTRFGLGASVWTNDLGKAGLFAAQIQAGAVFINAMVKSDPRLPFGGIKNSGYGRELSAFGAREFMNLKTVSYG